MRLSSFFHPSVIMLAVIAGMHGYIAYRIDSCIRRYFPSFPRWAAASVLTVLALILVFGFMRSLLPVSGALKEFLRCASAYWMGLFIYLFVFFLLSDVLVLIGRLLRLIPAAALPQARPAAGMTAMILSLAVSGYGIFHANDIQHAAYDVNLPYNTLDHGMNIVMISDLHLGAVGSQSRLEKIVARINALNPDIVCIAGDFFDSDFAAIKNPDKARQTLQKIHSAYGIYACLGNHDAGKTYAQMAAFLEESGIQALNDSYVIIDDRLVLAGRLDRSPIGSYNGSRRKDISDVLADVPEDLPVVVLDHNPAHIDAYTDEADLILCGHTHKGQIFPGSLFTNRMFTVDYGYYRRDMQSPHVIVSSGVGTWGMPMRVGTNSEVVSVALHP